MTGTAGTAEHVRYGGRKDFTERMSQIQYAFVDDPRKAALDADGLVSELLRSFADEMAQRRKELAAEPGDTNAPATEQLRNAVRRYRDFVDAMTRATTGVDGFDGFDEAVEAVDWSNGADGSEYAQELEPLEHEPDPQPERL